MTRLSLDELLKIARAATPSDGPNYSNEELAFRATFTPRTVEALVKVAIALVQQHEKSYGTTRMVLDDILSALTAALEDQTDGK